MATKNDITGDSIKTGHNSEAYRSNPFWNKKEDEVVCIEIGEGKLRVRIDIDQYGDQVLATRNGFQWSGIHINTQSAKMMIEALQQYVKLQENNHGD